MPTPPNSAGGTGRRSQRHPLRTALIVAIDLGIFRVAEHPIASAAAIFVAVLAIGVAVIAPISVNSASIWSPVPCCGRE